MNRGLRIVLAATVLSVWIGTLACTPSSYRNSSALLTNSTAQTVSESDIPYVWWVASSMERVLINAPRPATALTEARLALAGNEYESFQVILRSLPGHDLTDCTVELNDLEGDAGKIPKENIEWHQVGFVYLGELYGHPFLADAQPGWWPDPLLPVQTFDVSAETSQSIWFTVWAPPATPPGTYRGAITIRPGNDVEPLTVSVQVEVYGFDVPTQPHLKTAFSLMDGFLEKLYGKSLPSTLRRKYGDYLLRHRLNPTDISRTAPPDLDDLAYYDQRGLNAFNVLNLVEQREAQIWVGKSPLEVYTPVFKQELIQRLDPYVAELKRRGLADKAFVYGFDEQGREFQPIIREYFGLIKQRYGLPTLTTAKIAPNPQLLRNLNVDWICRLTSAYDFEQAEKGRKFGLQTWAYVCLQPRYPYANWLADDPLIEARVIWWQVYHQKIDGFLYWSVNAWGRTRAQTPIDPQADGPRLSWSITSVKNPRLHGDGKLLYPGREGPIGSIRLANIRDGIEDYEYLWKLAELERDLEKARQACLPVANSLTDFTREPQVVYRQRETIARRIEALSAR
ncbi:MAG: glycoside hydrolase domain-containing protein [Candidatus Zipacnadales bacterium]